MIPTLVSSAGARNSHLDNILELPERPDLLRMTALVEHLFSMPVACLALVDHTGKIATRIGSDLEHWEFLKTYAICMMIEAPGIAQRVLFGIPAGMDLGDIQFAASAPLITSSETSLGMLVIADLQARPDFSEKDARALSELARMLAGKMELRMIASHALESELAMRESERRFRAIANTAPVMIVYGGADGACSFVNKTWLDFTGRSMEEELGDGWADCIHPDSREMVYELYWRALQIREAFTVEFSMARHDGACRWMLAQAVPRFLDDGMFAGFVGTLVDITDYHNAILEVQKQALCTSAVANAAGLFYLILDPQGKIDYVSKICQHGCGSDHQNLLGSVIWETCTAAVQDGKVVRDAVERAASSRAMVKVKTKGESLDGETMELCWTINPIVATGELLALVATVAESNRFGAPSRVPIRCGCGQLTNTSN